MPGVSPNSRLNNWIKALQGWPSQIECDMADRHAFGQQLQERSRRRRWRQALKL
jgi:hypothetical protein